jgi:uncharacterized protein
MELMKPASFPHEDYRVTAENIDAVVARLVAFAHPRRIVMFGSAARGELHPESDLDLIVILPHDVPDWWAEAAPMLDVVRDIPMAKDILVLSETEAAEKMAHPRSIIGESLRNGKVVYETPL